MVGVRVEGGTEMQSDNGRQQGTFLFRIHTNTLLVCHFIYLLLYPNNLIYSFCWKQIFH